MRATPGTVGFLGNEANLTVLNANDPLGPLTGSAAWDTNHLKITASNFTLSNYRLNCPMFAQAGTGTLTVSNCIINETIGTIAGVYNYDLTGKIILRDTTITVPSVNGSRNWGAGCESNLIEAYRCDISGFEDGLAVGGATIIDQCYIHGVDGTGVDPHNDVIHAFPGIGNNLQVTNCYLVCSEFGSESTPSTGRSACLVVHDSGAVVTNNYMNMGPSIFRLEDALNVTATDNNFGPSFDFSMTSASGTCSVTLWSNNRDANGNLVSSPV